MSDTELKQVEGDATQVLADTKAEISKLESAEVSATGWVKSHTMWLVGVVCLVAGVILGHWLHK